MKFDNKKRVPLRKAIVEYLGIRWGTLLPTKTILEIEEAIDFIEEHVNLTF